MPEEKAQSLLPTAVPCWIHNRVAFLCIEASPSLVRQLGTAQCAATSKLEVPKDVDLMRLAITCKRITTNLLPSYLHLLHSRIKSLHLRHGHRPHFGTWPADRSSWAQYLRPSALPGERQRCQLGQSLRSDAIPTVGLTVGLTPEVAGGPSHAPVNEALCYYKQSMQINNVAIARSHPSIQAQIRAGPCIRVHQAVHLQCSHLHWQEHEHVHTDTVKTSSSAHQPQQTISRRAQGALATPILVSSTVYLLYLHHIVTACSLIDEKANIAT